MANALDELRKLAGQAATNENANAAINRSYDFDTWRQQDASLVTDEDRRIYDERRAAYAEKVAPALEANRERERYYAELAKKKRRMERPE